MANTTLYGALKALLEAAGLGIQVFHDAPPSKATLRNVSPPDGDGLLKAPYCVVIDGLSVIPDPLEDGGPAQGGEMTGREMLQLDLYQNWRDKDDKPLESKTLPDAITRAIHGARLPAAPMRVYALLQVNRIRTVERDTRLVHHAFDLRVARVI